MPSSPSLVSENPRQRPSRRFFTQIRLTAIQFLIIAVLYILSTGPMYWYCYSAYHLNGSTFLAKLYLPLVLACRIEIVNDFFDWYIGMWIN